MGYEAYNSARESQLRTGERERAEMREMMQQRTRREAGNALAGGDYGAASNALFQGGDLQGGMAVQGAQRSQQTADREGQRTAILAVVTGLRELPAEARAQQLAAIAPRLSVYGITPEQIGTITPEDLSDRGLDSLIATMGGEVQRPTTFSTRDGIVERDPYGGGYNLAYEVEQDPAAPAGYRWTADNNLEVIPGGPADPRIVGQRAAAGRAPARPRSGGGGGGSRPSGGSAPAAPSRKPWERF